MAGQVAGATKIMVIRHAEKPKKYGDTQYYGVDVTGAKCGSSQDKDLVTLGWQRAGALVTLFAKPWGPQAKLATPQYLYAASPAESLNKDKEPSQRPYETLLPLAARLGLKINTNFAKSAFKDMVEEAVMQPGVVLIAWQHENIALGTEADYGISHYILKETGTTADLGVCTSWPVANKCARYDLVFVFDRPSGEGPITKFELVAQQLLAGDGASASCT